MSRSRKYQHYLFVLVLFFSLLGTNSVHAGERTDIIDNSEAKIKLTATFDDIYYRGTKDGTISIRVELIEVDYKIVITDLYVALESIDRNPSYYTDFSNPVWLTLWRGMEVLNPATQSWVFTPISEIKIPEGQDIAWVHVLMKIRVYYSEKAYYSTWWETLREEATIMVQGNPITTTSEISPLTITETQILTSTGECIPITYTETVKTEETIISSVTISEKAGFVSGFGWILPLLALPMLFWIRRRRA